MPACAFASVHARAHWRAPLCAWSAQVPKAACVMDNWPMLPAEKSFFMRAMEGKKSNLDMDDIGDDEEGLPDGCVAVRHGGGRQRW